MPHLAATLCYQARIQELAEHCDHEFYMSAVGPPLTRHRAERGYQNIKATLGVFEALVADTDCEACRQELARQMALQTEALAGIETAWGPSITESHA